MRFKGLRKFAVLLAAAVILSGIPAVAYADNWQIEAESSEYYEDLVGIGITENTTGENRDVVLIGDSRIVYMHFAIFGGFGDQIFASDNTGDIWSAKGGAGYNWMVNTGVPQAESRIGSNTAVVIELGINDVLGGTAAYSDQYAAYLNQKAAQWTALGATVYYCSVMPVYEGKAQVTNAAIDEFNSYMKSKLNSNVHYLNMNQYMANTVAAIKADAGLTDSSGLHFSDDISYEWYNVLQNAVGGGNIYDAGTEQEQYEQLLQTYEPVYNYGFYINKYPDLKAAFGSDEYAALKHFINHGMEEGRQGSSSFNLEIYMANYPDLVAAFGDDKPSYYRHYISVGIDEGRNATTLINGDDSEDGQEDSGTTIYNGVNYSAVYNFSYYIGKYSDLKAAFGSDEKAALKHFVTYGMEEGRQGSSEFNVSIYMDNYSDLRAAFGSDLVSYYMHYMDYGKAEGRNGATSISGDDDSSGGSDDSGSDDSGSDDSSSDDSGSDDSGSDDGGDSGTTVYDGVDYSPVYDWDYYIGKYSDLKAAFGTNKEAALRHFVDYGMKEGRQASASFNLEAYKNRYADLRAAFGSDNKAYYIHYINYGKSEGRSAV